MGQPINTNLVRKSPRSTKPTTPKQPSIALTSEHAEQAMLFQWADLRSGRVPELRLLFAIPNFAGFHGSEEARIRSGARAKREGRRAGVPDLCLPVPRGGYHALYIEMKVGRNSPSAAQQEWHARLREYGNAVRVCYSMQEAQRELEAYLGLSSGSATA